MGPEKALAYIYNPLSEDIEREIRLPLFYSGLTEKAQMRVGNEAPRTFSLNRDYTVTVKLKIPAQSRQWVLFTAQ